MTHTRTRPKTWRHGWGVLIFLAALLAPAAAHAISSDIVISQVYGGGGNAGSVFTNDFIELHNRGTSPVNVSTWSVQYASAAGTSWLKTNLTGTDPIPAGGYLLIQMAAGTGGTTPLPTPEVIGTTNMSATAGKVALVNDQTTIGAISCPTGATIVDFVGFGTTANCFEGTGPTPAPSNTNAVLRGDAGCTETDSNSSDFAAGAPTPRNKVSAPVACFYSLTTTVVGNGSVSRSPNAADYLPGTSVDLSASADPNWHFVGWSGDASGSSSPVSVLMDMNKIVTATFEIDTYTLTYLAGAGGMISGTTTQVVGYGSDGTEVVAVANTGYHFVTWDDGVLTAARTDLGVTADLTATASFAINTYTLTYTAGANGMISGTSPQVVDHGANGSEVTAVADANYHFVSWSDGVLTATRTDENVTGDITVSATFAINTYTLTYTAGAGGSISGSAAQVVNHGADGTAVTAVADPNYHFVDWSDGNPSASRTETNVTANLSFTANFAIDTYTLTYSAGAGGTISGSAAQVVNHGANGTAVTAVADPNYHFVDWSDGGVNATRFETNVTANLSFTANFAIDTYTLSYTAGPGGTISGSAAQVVNHGANGTAVTAVADPNYHFVDWSDGGVNATRFETNVTANLSFTANFAIDTYTLSYTAGLGGTISGSAAQVVNHGANGTAVTAVADPNYHFVDWSDGGVNATRFETNVTANLSFTANFAIDTYTLSYTAGLGGTISGSAAQVVNHGANGTAVTAVADPNYHFVDWSDGGVNATRFETNVTANLSFTANFALDTYTLSYTAGTGGSITGSTLQVVNHGANGTAVTAVADANYHFVDWSDGGVNATRFETNVTTNLSFTANFTINTYKLAVIIVGSGTVTRDPVAEFYDYGTTVELAATPAAGWYLVNWTGAASGTTSPVFVFMDAIKSVTATFAINTYSLDVTVVGSGSVAKNPNFLEYSHGASVDLSATAPFGWTFSSWSGDATGSSNPVTLLMDANKAVTATFIINVYTLTVSTTGTGSVAKSLNQATYTHGTNVDLTASAGAGWFFVNWTGSATGSANPLTVLMDGNKSITAHFAVSGMVVVSQIYGGGGNTGATLKNDFIELFNRSDAPVSLAGWSVQYTSATGTGTWLTTPLAGSIAAGGYYLVQQAQGAGGTVDLPTPDAIGTIAMALGAGKVALVSNTTALSGCPGSGSVSDLVGYGSTANCFESAPTATLNNTTAGFRKGNGCVETNNNSADFLTGAPAPRNSASPINTCQYTITASSDPVSGGNVALAPNQASYQLATVVQVTAVKAYGYHFVGWSGDASGLVNPIQVVMDGDKTFVAHFALNTVAGVVVISQVYGGGGNTGAQYTNDYIELFNRGNATIDITGWSLQYAAADGNTWTGTTLVGSIPAGGYFLVRQAAGAGGIGAPLPTPDNIGDIEMGAVEGKVALVSNTTTLSSNCPTGVHIIDFVGYGAADCSEGSPASDIDNVTALFRNEDGCRDKDDNLTDFSVAAPAPRNSATPINTCDEWLAVDEEPAVELALGALSPNPTRGALHIPFALPRESEVRIRVLDIQGRIVASVAEGVFSAGRHELTWSGITRSGPARSGVYFVQMNVAGKDFVKRISVTN